MANPVKFPNRAYNLNASLWVVQQDIANNLSLVAWQLFITNAGASTPSYSGVASPWGVSVNGIVMGSGTFTYDFNNYDTLIIGQGQTWFSHNADGTLPLNYFGYATADILGHAEVTLSGNAPVIARASVPSFPNGNSFDAGSTVVINTNRAAGTTFTHDIRWSFGSLTDQTAGLPSGGNGIATTANWVPPLTALAQIPNATSGTGTLTVTTKSGSTVIGTPQSIPFTLRAGAGVVPTISGVTLADANTTVASQIGGYVQGKSELRATVTAAGVQGSTISSRFFTHAGNTQVSGSTVPMPNSGASVPVTAQATDSRGRTANWSGNVNVLPYTSPVATTVVRRSDAAGTPTDTGTSLRVDISSAAIASLIVGTQKNAMTIRVFTKPYGAPESAWTARNVVSPTGITYSGNFVVSGGANYPINQSFDVRVQIQDKLEVKNYLSVVATSAVFMHWTPTAVGIGKYWQQGQLDVAGSIYSGNSLVLTAANLATYLPTATTAVSGMSPLATNAETIAGTVATKSVTPAALNSRTSTSARTGLVQLSTQAQADAGTDATTAMTPKQVRDRSYAPYAMAGGRATSPTSGVVTVTFPAGRFTVAPLVTIQPLTHMNVLAAPRIAANPTTTSFQAQLWTISGGQVVCAFDWTATQMTSGSESG